MSKRLLALLILVIAIVPLSSVYAQSTNEGIDYCAIMESDDCQILVSSAEEMSQVSSFAFDMNMTYDILIEGDTSGMGDMSFGLTGNGQIALDTAFFNQLQDLAMNDPAAYMDQLPMMMDGIFSGFEGEANFVVTLPDMFGAMMGVTEIPLNVLMENGVYAIDVATLETAVGEEPSGLAWAGIDLNGAFEAMFAELDFSSMYDPAMMESFMQFDSSMFNDVITINRLADSTVNGEAVAVFEMIFDYGAFLTTGDMADTIQTMYNDMGMSQEEIDMAISMLSDIDVFVVQYIGLDDFYNHRIEMSMDFGMDGEMMGDPSMESMSFGFDLAIDMSEFNGTVDVTIPDDAMIMPFEMLMGGGF